MKKNKLFDFAIGNPPYQGDSKKEESKEGNKTFAPPVYNTFLDNAYKVADKVELIHPARFLFNQGSTPKPWNQKMLNDPHFKVMQYWEDASVVFHGPEIKGGVVVSYHDQTRNFGPIEVFTKYDKQNAILQKVIHRRDFQSMEPYVVTRTAYRLTDKLHHDHPEAVNQLSDGHAYDMSTNIFERLPQIFFDKQPSDGRNYIRVLGRENNKRVIKFVRTDYVNGPENLKSYKVVLPKGSGTGLLGETLATPEIAEPGNGLTETFISIGSFKKKIDAENLVKYIKTKFLRIMLGVLKATQNLKPEVWKYVPLQDFSPSSDIDWSQSIKDIDQQLYRKYGLSDDEIEFIETHVKEMN